MEGVYVFPLPETRGASTICAMLVGAARHRGADPRARGGAGGSTTAAKANGTEGLAGRAGAAEHLHHQRRQHRAGGDGGDRARVPGDGAARRRRVQPPLSARRRAALHPGAPPAEDLPAEAPPPQACMAGRALPTDPVPDAHASPRRSPPGTGQSGAPGGRARSRASRSVALQPVASRSPTAPVERFGAAGDAGRRGGPGRPGLRADLGAGRQAATPQAALFTEGDGGDTYALLMVMPPEPGDAARRAAARDRLRHRHLGLDGRCVDRAGQAGPHHRARPAAAGGPLQRHRVQHATCSSSSRESVGGRRGATSSRRETGSTRCERERRHRDAPGARGGLDGAAAPAGAAGHLRHRRRGRQRDRALRLHPGAPGRRAGCSPSASARRRTATSCARRRSSAAARSPSSAAR